MTREEPAGPAVHGAAHAAGPSWAGPTSLVTSVVATVLVLAVSGASPVVAEVGGWPVVPFVPGALGLLLLPVPAVRRVAMGLVATLALPLLWLVLVAVV